MTYYGDDRYQFQNKFIKAYRRVKYFPLYIYDIFSSIILEYMYGILAIQNKQILADRIEFYKKHNKPVPNNVVYERPLRTIMTYAKAMYSHNVGYWLTAEESICEIKKYERT